MSGKYARKDQEVIDAIRKFGQPTTAIVAGILKVPTALWSKWCV